ncbi:F-ATPase epsilon subunit [Luteitalea pratensis]|jgi:F-type H+-transporting ATPase subunit epsilon|uniref:ATP synthase epsilon chain n=1 Tax=Luteitalea pratensis TaxID=1855912 RepID=A0A143PYY8_LUTPR|nr:F0F1 ATP synthase subunit epsilon [Luteitalea pratensis]AMY13024.1 F-ATPase epsilon subunit [Luteitalea pratensis]
MASQLTLSIVTPERELVRVQADEVELPGTEGYFGVLPGHTPLLAALTVGRLTYRVGQERHVLAIATGLAEVLPDQVTVLSQIAELPEDIDVGRAEEARKRAQARLGSKGDDLDYERARNALDKAILRLQVASRARAR